jgi:hypothetical protein
MSRLWLIGAGVALAALLVASIAVALLREPESFGEDTPERAVQLYLAALADDDFAAAHELLSSDMMRRCPLTSMVRGLYAKEELGDSRVMLKESTLVDGTAFVTARVTRIRSSGPFDTSESSHEQRYTLVEEDGEWRLSDNMWPSHGCPITEPTPPVRQALPATTPRPAAGGGERTR